MANNNGRFNELFNLSKEEQRAATLNSRRNALARKIQSGIDTAQADIESAEARLERLFGQITENGDMDLNGFIDCRQIILDSGNTVTALQDLYKDLFGVEYNGVTV